MGRQVAALLDVETPVEGVTHGSPRPDLLNIAQLKTTDNQAPDFTVNVRWGYFGQGGAVMPGRGKVTEWNHETRGYGERAGDVFCNVFLNDNTYWVDIPLPVWDYTLGGYQVLKKWLSYRETSVLGRPLKAEEVREFMHIARRIAALLSLNPSLDVQYHQIKSSTG